MDNEFIKKCIETRELQLTSSERNSHFFPVVFLLIPIVFALVMGIYEIINKVLSDELTLSDFNLIWLSLFFALLSYLIYRMQKNALEFTSFSSELSLPNKHKIVNMVGQNLNWKKVFEKENIIIGKTPYKLSSWGEHITVIFHKDEVFINSICDLDKKVSVIGDNHKNVNAFIDEFEKTENHSKPDFTIETENNRKLNEKVANDKLVLINNIEKDVLDQVIKQFCEMYNEHTIRALPELSIMSDGSFVITFPNNIDFVTFCYFVNYLHYPFDLEVNPKIRAWMTTEAEDWIKEDIVNKQVILYVLDDDDEYDNVYLTSEDNIGYKMGFAMGEESQKLKEPILHYKEPPILNL